MRRSRCGRSLSTAKPPSRMSATVMGRSPSTGVPRIPAPAGAGAAPSAGSPRALAVAGVGVAAGGAHLRPGESSIGAIIPHERARMDGYGPSTYGEGFADVYDDWYGN